LKKRREEQRSLDLEAPKGREMAGQETPGQGREEGGEMRREGGREGGREGKDGMDALP
jgi:hypothetical protein